MALDNLVSIGGVEFTDEGRSFSEQRDERAVSVELASGKIVKYIKKEALSFQLDWQYLPLDSTHTLDGRGARNELRPLCYDGNTTTLVVRNQYGSSETYTVFIESYQETMLRRDPSTGNILFNIEISLKEQ